MSSQMPRVGIVSFADSRSDQALHSEAYRYIQDCHTALARDLAARGFQVIDALAVKAAGHDGFAPITSLAERESW